MCSCLWGGRYNPIIPFFEDAPQRWIGPFRRVPGFDVARGYINFFEPDVLVDASEGMAARIGWSDLESRFDLPRVVPLDKFYRLDDRGRVEAAGIDAIDVMHYLHDREFKYQRRRKVPFAWVESVGDDAFFDVLPGVWVRVTIGLPC